MRTSMYNAAFLLLGLVILVNGAVVIPMMLSVSGLNEDIANAQILTERQYRQRQSLKETVTKLDTIRSSTGSLSAFAIHEGDELEFIQAIESIASDNGVELDIELLTVNQEELTDWHHVIPIRLNVSGSYHNVLVFIRKVEELPYAVLIRTIQFAPMATSKSKEPTGVSAALTGDVHWLSHDAPAFVNGE